MLKAYSAPPLGIDKEFDRCDYFTANGIDTYFPLVAKTGLRCGNAIQYDHEFKSRAKDDYVVDTLNDKIIFPTAPLVGTKIVVPGINRYRLRAYDVATVPGEATPLVFQESFYLADVEDIASYKHKNISTASGILVSLADFDITFGLSTTDYQLAMALGSGGPDTFGAAGASIEIPTFEVEDTLSGAIAAGVTSIDVTDGSQFNVGDLLVLDANEDAQDECVIESIASDTLNVTAMDHDHADGITVYQTGRKLWGQVTVPEGAAGNSAINFYDMSINWEAVTESRF